MEAVIVIASVAALSAAMMAPGAAGPWALLVLAGLLGWSVGRRAFPAIQVCLFGALWAGTAVLFSGSWVWPIRLVAPLAAYAVVVAPTPIWRRSVDWLRAGRLDREMWGWIALVAAVSSAALVAWVKLTGPDLAIHLANIPDIPVWTYPLAAVVFAGFNAAIEELAFRGIVMGALEWALGENAWAVAVQALCFGAAHFLYGFPNGWLGLSMATAYGAMLGGIRLRSGGLLAAWVAHVCADLTIFALVAA